MRTKRKKKKKKIGETSRRRQSRQRNNTTVPRDGSHHTESDRWRVTFTAMRRRGLRTRCCARRGGNQPCDARSLTRTHAGAICTHPHESGPSRTLLSFSLSLSLSLALSICLSLSCFSYTCRGWHRGPRKTKDERRGKRRRKIEREGTKQTR